MNGRVLGLVLLCVGVVLVAVGLIAADSAGEQLTKTFTGEFSDKTTFFILGGLVSAILGTVLTVTRKSTA